MRSLTTTTLSALAAKSVEQIYLYEFDIDSSTIRLAAHGDNVVFSGQTYLAAPIVHDGIGSNSDGTINDIKLTVADQSGGLRELVRQHVIEGSKMRIIEVFPTTSEAITIPLTIKSVSSSYGVITMTLSLGFDVFSAAVPGRVAFARHCRWIFSKDLPVALVGSEVDVCKYAGADTTCGKTWENCVAKGNQSRFGGFPGIRNSWLIF